MTLHLLAQAGPSQTWDWDFALRIVPDLLSALRITVQATLLGSAIAMSLGLVFALMRRSDSWLLRWPAVAVIEFIRSTPLLVHLFFMFYALPRLGITLSALTAGVIALGVHYATYTSEVYRAGIESVPAGQWEASTALNFTTRDTWRRIVLPQAIPAVLPPLGNYFIAMFKETPLLFAITVVEVFNQARIIGSQTFRYLEAYTLVGLLFFLLSYPSVLGLRKLEARLATE